MRLLLIRHGQTPSNVAGLLDTAGPGPGLTDLGREQADAVVPALAGVPVDAIFASTQRRSQLTAAPLAVDRGVEVVVRDGIREISAGAMDMSGAPDDIHRYLTLVGHWMSGGLDERMPGPGTSGREVLDRFDDVVAEAERAGDDVALFSHGAVLRFWAASRAGNVTPSVGALRPLHNTGIIVLEGGAGPGWTVRTWAGEPVGGPQLDEPSGDGPAAEPVPAEAVSADPFVQR